MNKKLLFLALLCITTHIFTMKPERSSQLILSNHSLHPQRALIKAVSFNDAPVLTYLIQKKRDIDLNVKYNNFNNTLLHVAATLEYPNIVNILLKNGALPNAQNKNGVVPLSYALANKNIPCIKLLLKHGADQTIQNVQGDTPIFWLYKDGDNIVKDLLTKEEIQRVLKIHNILVCDRLEKFLQDQILK